MATVTFSNGKSVNFNGTPTQADIEEVAAKMQQTQDPPVDFSQSNLPGKLSAPTAPVAKPQIGDIGKGLISTIGNVANSVAKPYADIAAIPLQGVAKLAGFPDPFASTPTNPNPLDTNPLGPRKIGSALQVGADIGSAAIGNPEEALTRSSVESMLAQNATGQVDRGLASNLAQAATKTSATKKIGTFALAGGIGGLGASISQGGSAGDMTRSAVTSAITNGILMGTGQAGGALAHSLTGTVPENIMTKIFKDTNEDISRVFNSKTIAETQQTDPARFKTWVDAGVVTPKEDGGYAVNTTLAKQALDRGYQGNLETMAQRAIGGTHDSEVALQDAIQNIKTDVPVTNPKGLKTILTGLKDDYKGQYNGKAVSTQINGYITDLKDGKLSPENLLGLRRMLDDHATAATYKTFQPSRMSPTAESLQSALGDLRGTLNSLPGMRDVMKDYQFNIRAKNAIVKEAVRSGNQSAIGLIDASLFAGGEAFGHPLLGAMTATARRSLALPVVQTSLAQGLNSAGNFGSAISSQIPSAANPAARVLTTMGVGRLLGNSSQ